MDDRPKHKKMKQSKLKESIGEFLYDLEEGKVFSSYNSKIRSKKIQQYILLVRLWRKEASSDATDRKAKWHNHCQIWQNLAKPNKIKADSLLRLSPKTLSQQI